LIYILDKTFPIFFTGRKLRPSGTEMKPLSTFVQFTELKYETMCACDVCVCNKRSRLMCDRYDDDNDDVIYVCSVVYWVIFNRSRRLRVCIPTAQIYGAS